MDKLRATIGKYPRWKELDSYIDRIEAYLFNDFSLALENAKALLESIAKEICDLKAQEISKKEDFHHLVKMAFIAIGHQASDAVSQISRSLSNIAKEIGTLRNEISPTSHGRTQAQLRDRNESLDELSRDFLIDSTLVVAVFLIRSFEERRESNAGIEPEIDPELDYEELSEFNDYWDDMFEDYKMGAYSYTASEILFRVDYQAYENEYRTFLEAEPEPDAEEAE